MDWVRFQKKRRTVHPGRIAGGMFVLCGSFVGLLWGQESDSQLEPPEPVPAMLSPREAFAKGMELAAQEANDEAKRFFESATLATDMQLAAASYYNLAGLAVREIQARVSDRLLTLETPMRNEVLADVDRAVEMLRLCLEVDPGHSEARHNLELLQLWRRNTVEAWESGDRQRRREESPPLQFLNEIIEGLDALRGQTYEQSAMLPSPQRRWECRQLAETQNHLREDVPYLIGKLLPDADLSATDRGSHHDWLRLRATIEEELSGATMALRDVDFAQALSGQEMAADGLDTLYRDLVSFDALLERAIDTQSKLLDFSRHRHAASSGVDEPVATDPLQAEAQARIAMWMSALADKAKLQLAQQETSGHHDPHSPRPDAWRKAIEVAPPVRDLVSKVADAIRSTTWNEAATHQEQILRLLREIQQHVPPPPQSQSPQNSPSSNNQDPSSQPPPQQPQEPNAEESPSPSPDATQPEPQPPQSDSGSNDQVGPENDSNPVEPGEEEQSASTDEQDAGDTQASDGQEKRPTDAMRRGASLAPQEVEALLQQALEREREYRRLRAQLRKAHEGRTRVERDW